MTSNYKKIFLPITLSLIVSCSKVLETATLELDNADPLEQEQFTVVEKTLTLSDFIPMAARDAVGLPIIAFERPDTPATIPKFKSTSVSWLI